MMDNAKAKAVLVAMLKVGQPCGGKITADSLECSEWDYTSVTPEGAGLDGSYSADELEAIAAWMRDPKGVSEA